MNKSETEALQREIANTLQMLDNLDTALEILSRSIDTAFQHTKKNKKENK